MKAVEINASLDEVQFLSVIAGAAADDAKVHLKMAVWADAIQEIRQMKEALETALIHAELLEGTLSERLEQAEAQRVLEEVSV